MHNVSTSYTCEPKYLIGVSVHMCHEIVAWCANTCIEELFVHSYWNFYSDGVFEAEWI